MKGSLDRAGEFERVRIDKWLWAARFFKTRHLAHEAVQLGRVLVNDERVKPSRTLTQGDRLCIRVNQLEVHVQVLSVATLRKAASQVHLLYQESAESIARREAQMLQLRAERASQPHAPGRPTKRARRDLMRMKDSY